MDHKKGLQEKSKGMYTLTYRGVWEMLGHSNKT